MGRYRFNREQLRFVEERRGIGGWLKKGAKYIVASMLLAIVYYFAVSLFFSTDEERRLQRENRLLEKEYAELSEKIKLLDNTVENLQIRDREIYRSIFKADPPRLFRDGSDPDEFFAQIDTAHNNKLIEYAGAYIVRAEEDARQVSRALAGIDTAFRSMGEAVRSIPSVIPVRNFSLGQTGASVGRKVNPFYKSMMEHTGIDLLGAAGTEVIAAADGLVEETVRSKRGEGNTVVINHQNGYVTRYTHLDDILVRKGQRIRQKTVIGTIGMSGLSFAPHLHYEVLFRERYQDPVNYFFADADPVLFRELAVIAANSGQSLD